MLLLFFEPIEDVYNHEMDNWKHAALENTSTVFDAVLKRLPAMWHAAKIGFEFSGAPPLDDEQDPLIFSLFAASVLGH